VAPENVDRRREPARRACRTSLHHAGAEAHYRTGLAQAFRTCRQPAPAGSGHSHDLRRVEQEARGSGQAATRLRDADRVVRLPRRVFHDTPAVVYNPGHLAGAMKSVLQQTKTPIGPPPTKAKQTTTPDWGNAESILGQTGKRNGKLLQFSIPRAETISEDDMEIPPFMGMATGINMQMEGKKAATTGDFVLLADEVNPVIRALTENGLAVTAVHNHMLNEMPRLFFVHFWGYDDPEKIARGLRAALDRTTSAQKK
ncbi:MAG: DUF1259 domain-containing protein, partial [Ignavibacteriae bacterium]|nr:DUF1259 domain-containing protein [Ignavibacteriota bacterium]